MKKGGMRKAEERLKKAATAFGTHVATPFAPGYRGEGPTEAELWRELAIAARSYAAEVLEEVDRSILADAAVHVLALNRIVNELQERLRGRK